MANLCEVGGKIYRLPPLIENPALTLDFPKRKIDMHMNNSNCFVYDHMVVNSFFFFFRLQQRRYLIIAENGQVMTLEFPPLAEKAQKRSVKLS